MSHHKTAKIGWNDRFGVTNVLPGIKKGNKGNHNHHPIRRKDMSTQTAKDSSTQTEYDDSDNISMNQSDKQPQQTLRLRGHDSHENKDKAYPLCRLDMIGRGSTTTVYKAVLLNSLVLCAEKVIVVKEKTKRDKLFVELQYLKTLLNDSTGRTKCIQLVSLLDIIPNPRDGTLSLCVEYMDGGSLQDLINIGVHQDLEDIQNIAKQILTGLSFLHSIRVIHRDVKPLNALVNSEGMVKLTDYGVDLSGMGTGKGYSKASRNVGKGNSSNDSDEFSLMTESEMFTFRGSFDYMAPERMIGGACSFPSDIWSFGVTIHAVAIGGYPYAVDKGDFWGILNALQEQPIPLPSSSDFSNDFVDFVRQACARESNRRPTALQLLNHPFIVSSPPSSSSNYHAKRCHYAVARKPLLATVPEKVTKKKRDSGTGAASILGLGSSRETSCEGGRGVGEGTGGGKYDLPRGRKSNTTEGTRARTRVVEETRASWSQKEGRRTRPRHLHPLSPTKDNRRTKSSSSSAWSSSSSSKSKSPTRRPQPPHQQPSPSSSSSTPKKTPIPSISPHRHLRSTQRGHGIINKENTSPSRVSLPRKQLIPIQGRGSISKLGSKSASLQRDQSYPDKRAQHHKGYHNDGWKSHDKDTNNDDDHEDVPQPLFPSSTAEALHIAKAWKSYVRSVQHGQQHHGDGDIMALTHDMAINMNNSSHSNNSSSVSTSMNTSNHRKDQGVDMIPSSVPRLTTAAVDALALQLCHSNVHPKGMHEKQEALRHAFYMTTMTMVIDQDQGQGLDRGLALEQGLNYQQDPDQRPHQYKPSQRQDHGHGENDHQNHNHPTVKSSPSKKVVVPGSGPVAVVGDSTSLRGGGIAVGSIRATKKSPRPSVRMTGYDREEDDDEEGYDQGQGLGLNVRDHPRSDSSNHPRSGSGSGGNVFALTAGFSMYESDADDDEIVDEEENRVLWRMKEEIIPPPEVEDEVSYEEIGDDDAVYGGDDDGMKKGMRSGSGREVGLGREVGFETKGRKGVSISTNTDNDSNDNNHTSNNNSNNNNSSNNNKKKATISSMNPPQINQSNPTPFGQAPHHPPSHQPQPQQQQQQQQQQPSPQQQQLPQQLPSSDDIPKKPKKSVKMYVPSPPSSPPLPVQPSDSIVTHKDKGLETQKNKGSVQHQDKGYSVQHQDKGYSDKTEWTPKRSSSPHPAHKSGLAKGLDKGIDKGLAKGHGKGAAKVPGVGFAHDFFVESEDNGDRHFEEDEYDDDDLEEEEGEGHERDRVQGQGQGQGYDDNEQDYGQEFEVEGGQMEGGGEQGYEQEGFEWEEEEGVGISVTPSEQSSERAKSDEDMIFPGSHSETPVHTHNHIDTGVHTHNHIDTDSGGSIMPLPSFSSTQGQGLGTSPSHATTTATEQELAILPSPRQFNRSGLLLEDVAFDNLDSNNYSKFRKSPSKDLPLFSSSTTIATIMKTTTMVDDSTTKGELFGSGVGSGGGHENPPPAAIGEVFETTKTTDKKSKVKILTLDQFKQRNHLIDQQRQQQLLQHQQQQEEEKLKLEQQQQLELQRQRLQQEVEQKLIQIQKDEDQLLLLQQQQQQQQLLLLQMQQSTTKKSAIKQPPPQSTTSTSTTNALNTKTTGKKHHKSKNKSHVKIVLEPLVPVPSPVPVDLAFVPVQPDLILASESMETPPTVSIWHHNHKNQNKKVISS